MPGAALRHIIATDEQPKEPGRIKIFLGGSIELGKAEDWQTKLVEFLQTLSCADRFDVYNPRRGGKWDPSWVDHKQGPFREQVDWELRHQKDADLVVYYFAADTISPITLLELGLFHRKNPVIGMDPAYKRTGNLIITGEHFDFDLHTGWEAFTAALAARLNSI